LGEDLREVEDPGPCRKIAWAVVKEVELRAYPKNLDTLHEQTHRLSFG
jgi:hypothetical protein